VIASTGDVYAELERLRRLVDAIESYCDEITPADPADIDQLDVARDILDIIRAGR
jgi:hypothetical protein